MPDDYLGIKGPPGLGLSSQVLKRVAPTTTPQEGQQHVLVKPKMLLLKAAYLVKLFAHITAICVQGSLKQVHVWKAIESTRGSEIHKPGRDDSERSCSWFFQIEKHSGNRAGAACLGWFLLT